MITQEYYYNYRRAEKSHSGENFSSKAVRYPFHTHTHTHRLMVEGSDDGVSADARCRSTRMVGMVRGCAKSSIMLSSWRRVGVSVRVNRSLRKSTLVCVKMRGLFRRSKSTTPVTDGRLRFKNDKLCRNNWLSRSSTMYLQANNRKKHIRRVLKSGQSKVWQHHMQKANANQNTKKQSSIQKKAQAWSHAGELRW